MISISRSQHKIDFNYTIGGNSLERVQEYQDLCILIDSTLSLHGHIQSVISKGSQMSGMIKRAVGFAAPQVVTLQLFKSLVRSNLEFILPSIVVTSFNW